MSFIVEEPGANSVHPCTVDDVTAMLGLIPASDWAGIRAIVFRQPTRKQAILNPAWGRLCYAGEISTGRNQIVATGPMILFDAIDEKLRITWSKSRDPQSQAELDRLRADGHAIERAGGSHVIKVTPSSARIVRWTDNAPKGCAYALPLDQGPRETLRGDEEWGRHSSTADRP